MRLQQEEAPPGEAGTGDKEVVMLSPFRGFMDTQGEINRMLDDMLGGLSRRPARQPERWAPATDVLSRDGDLVLRAELPGVKQEDVDVTLSNGVLTISGERRDEQEKKGAGYHTRELRYGTFSRSMRIPDNLGSEDIHARFEDGVLEVTLKGAAAVQEPQRIQVEGGEDSQSQIEGSEN
jgi:HSP20 family protein